MLDALEFWLPVVAIVVLIIVLFVILDLTFQLLIQLEERGLLDGKGIFRLLTWPVRELKRRLWIRQWNRKWNYNNTPPLAPKQ